MQFNRHFEPVYPKAEFYNTAKARGRMRHLSREIDFGLMWRDQEFPGRYSHLTWVAEGGEFVNIYNDEITVLGMVEGEEQSEAVLKDWAQACTGEDGLAWVRTRLASTEVASTLWIPAGHRRVSRSFELLIDAQERILRAVANTDIGGETAVGGFTMPLSQIPELVSGGQALLREIAAHAPAKRRVVDVYALVANLSYTLISLESVWGGVPCRAEPWEFEALLSGLSAWLDEVYESLGEQ